MAASILDLNSDLSDSEDDADYVPPAGEISEPSGDDACSEDELEGKNQSKKTNRTKKNKVKGDNERNGSERIDEKPELTAEVQKKHADDLWENFMKDVEPIPKKKLSTTVNSSSNGVEKTAALTPPASIPSSKVTVTEVYDFAGEEIKVTKEVDLKSLKPSTSPDEPKKLNRESPAAAKLTFGSNQKRPAKGGLASVMGALSKKTKLSVLQKTMLDWKSFKRDEGIEEELEHHNKGKDGFLEKQAFLQRSDLKQFEIEKSLRLSKRSKP